MTKRRLFVVVQSATIPRVMVARLASALGARLFCDGLNFNKLRRALNLAFKHKLQPVVWWQREPASLTERQGQRLQKLLVRVRVVVLATRQPVAGLWGAATAYVVPRVAPVPEMLACAPLGRLGTNLVMGYSGGKPIYPAKVARGTPKR